MTFIKKNQDERFRFVDTWADYVKSHSDKEWSKQQNIIINSCLRSASLTKEQFLNMKKEKYNKI
ncbi:MAG: hypothetical protein V1726_07345 [Methanobacteriota archaeon]